MKILITGGGGYVGTVLTRQLLLHTAHTVTILDRFAWGVQPILSVIRPKAARRIDLIRGEICEAATIRDAISRCDAVIHLAAIVGFPACDAHPEEATKTNVEGTQQVCDALQNRRLLYASTGSVYGKVEEMCTEDSPVDPLTHYGQTKLQAERMVLDAGGMAFRIATIYGLSPRMCWDLLVHDFARLGVQGEIALFDPGARRTFLHIEDVARAFLWGLDQYTPGVFNLGDEANNRTKQQVAEVVQTLTGCRLVDMTGHDPDERDYKVSYAKLAQAGWKATHRFNAQTVQPIVDAAWVWKD